ncbi:ATP synthase A1 subunit C [Candidatus Woesearchaeota archaeon]|nr:ATP synthase A1 subunit C [Candidatus Woesearchaeota archaeon]
MLQKHYSKASKGTLASLTAARYPYTYARVAFMRAALLTRGAYAKTIKMSLSEIASFLETTEYKKEIDELAVNYSGAELLETAINKQLANTYIKLRSISKPELRLLIGVYLKRKDIANIKTVLRGKYTSAGEKEIAAMLQPYELSREFLKGLLKKQDMAEILRDAKLASHEEIKEAHGLFKETNALAEIENALDKSYYTKVLDVANKLPKNTLFRRFLQEEINIINILNILRFKREGMEKKSIYAYVIRSGKGADEKTKKLIEAGNEELPSALEATKYGAIAKQGVSEWKSKGTLARIETDLHRYLLKIALTLARRRPLSSDAILGYMFAKEAEAKNLKLIVKAKQLGLNEEFIEEHLIT